MSLNHGLFLMVFCFVLIGCENKKELSEAQDVKVDSLAIRKAFDTAPVLSPKESLDAMEIADGFKVELVAAEPLIAAPVDLAFDEKGRPWVVEMTGYMPNLEGTGEDIPNGKIVILEDHDKDGIADERKVFLDSLVLPRAITFIDDGILVAEPPNLWYYEIEDDKPVKKTLVDATYAVGGNAEHQPNGLFRAMDNWIYNAKSSKRYKKEGDQWIIEKTHRRGQWGISQDNLGRLYYNNNSTNLKGDYYSPGFGAGNKNQEDIAGYREVIVSDDRVFPIRPTPGVNRGYLEEVLDDSLRLVDFTAASGPVIYRGNLFGEEFDFNAFVAEPAGNLIKRDILKTNGLITTGTQAYESKEFLASTDERFRPVTLFNGPDGALYIIDMYRGIIQHKTFITPYLEREIKSRGLTLPLSYGRIYKVVPEDKEIEVQKIPENPNELVSLLDHPNGWVRDKAQQKLIDDNITEAIPDLRRALQHEDNPLLVMHALWALEGLDALKNEEVLALLEHPDWPVRMQALSVLPSIINKKNYRQYLAVLHNMVEQKDHLAAPYVGFLAETIANFDQEAAYDLLKKVVKKYPDNKYVADAAISSLEGYEAQFLKNIAVNSPDETLAIEKGLKNVIKEMQESANEEDQELVKAQYPKGAALFAAICQTCHGEKGNGIASLAPPLNNSEWVTGNKKRLISLVLFGLSGPIKVNGKLYESGQMPGVAHDPSISNEEVAQLLSYIRNSWKNNADEVRVEEVAEIRQEFKDRNSSFTVEEINDIFQE